MSEKLEVALKEAPGEMPAGTARNGLLLAGSVVLAAVMVLAAPAPELATAAEHAPKKAAESKASTPLDLAGIIDAFDRGEGEKVALRLRHLASEGNPEAQLFLGDMYMEGRGIYQNYSMAGNWYKKAAQSGNAESQFKLAGMYQKGLGVPLYINRGQELLMNAAMQGHPGAIESLKNRGIKPPAMMLKDGEDSKDGKGKKTGKKEDAGPPGMEIKIAGMGPAAGKIDPAVTALVEGFADAVNSKDLAKLKKLMGPEYAACANGVDKAIYDQYLSDGMGFDIGPGYAVSFGPLSPAALPFLDIVNYPVPPGHYVQIDLPLQPPMAGQKKIEYGTTIIQPLVNADGKWSLAFGCPTPLGIKRMRKSGMVGEG